MNNISKIKHLSFWVFLSPLVTINVCLIIVIFFQEYIPHGVGIGPTFPYIDGGISISRSARTYPTYLLFKPGMIITALLLILYWIENNKLFKKINGENFKNKYFMFFGIASAIFLILHSIFLGINYERQLLDIFSELKKFNNLKIKEMQRFYFNYNKNFNILNWKKKN